MRDYALGSDSIAWYFERRSVARRQEAPISTDAANRIVGEAASRVPEEVRLLHPTIPWRVAANMRNRLIHGYDLIDYDIVFDTVTVDLPNLVRMLDPILSS
jgi:uncharacterized protein with HEPN domain